MAVRKACDYCRYRRVKCSYPDDVRGPSDGQKCEHCQASDIACTFGQFHEAMFVRKRRKRNETSPELSKQKAKKKMNGVEKGLPPVFNPWQLNIINSGPEYAFKEAEILPHSPTGWHEPASFLSGLDSLSNAKVYAEYIEPYLPFLAGAFATENQNMLFDICIQLLNPNYPPSIVDMMHRMRDQELSKVTPNAATTCALLFLMFRDSIPELRSGLMQQASTLSKHDDEGEMVAEGLCILDAWLCAATGTRPRIPSFKTSRPIHHLFYNHFRSLSFLLHHLLLLSDDSHRRDILQVEFELLQFPIKLPPPLFYIPHKLGAREPALLHVCHATIILLYYTSQIGKTELGLQGSIGLLLFCSTIAESIYEILLDHMPELLAWTMCQTALKVSVNTMVDTVEKYQSEDASLALKRFMDSSPESTSELVQDLRTMASPHITLSLQPKNIDASLVFWVFRDTRSTAVSALLL